MTRVVFLQPPAFPSEQIDVMHRIPGIEIVVLDSHDDSMNEVIERTPDVNILVVEHHARGCTADTLDRLPNLHTIAVLGVDSRHIDEWYCERRNIKIISFPGSQTVALTEFAFTYALMLSHKVHLLWRHVLVNQTEHTKIFRGWQLSGRTLGVIGAGALGAELVRVGHAFGMDVRCTTKHPSKARAQSLGLSSFCDLNTLLSEADVVMPAIPLTSTTAHMLSSRQFRRMNPDALLVNVVNEGIVDIPALASALYEHRIAGAALHKANLDRVGMPPVLLAEMQRSPNVLLLPDLSAQTHDTRADLGAQLIDILNRSH
jgi:D-3-phosphoglycerate dehydrogenase